MGDQLDNWIKEFEDEEDPKGEKKSLITIKSAMSLSKRVKLMLGDFREIGKSSTPDKSIIINIHRSAI